MRAYVNKKKSALLASLGSIVFIRWQGQIERQSVHPVVCPACYVHMYICSTYQFLKYLLQIWLSDSNKKYIERNKFDTFFSVAHFTTCDDDDATHKYIHIYFIYWKCRIRIYFFTFERKCRGFIWQHIYFICVKVFSISMNNNKKYWKNFVLKIRISSLKILYS